MTQVEAQIISALHTIVGELSAIRLLLLPPAVPLAPTPCMHPFEQRVSMAGMGESDEFFCRACEQQIRIVQSEARS